MRTTASLQHLVLAAAVALCATPGVAAQEKAPQGGAMVGGTGTPFTASFKTRTEPTTLGQTFSFMAEIDANVIHRVWVDKAAGTYFGYDLEIEPTGARQFKVAIAPLDPQYARRLETSGRLKLLGRAPRGGAGSGPLASLQPLVIDDGDTIALDVLVNHQMGVKLVDMVTISASRPPFPQLSPGPARDFTLSDVQLTLRGQQLFLNGQLVGGGASHSCSGELIYFYLRGKGRFILSIKLYEGYGFQRLGEIVNNRISFSADGDRYEWISSVPVIGAGGRWNLWVLHQPNYQPEPYVGETGFAFGALGGVSSLRRDK